jgi:hypothetical protein
MVLEAKGKFKLPPKGKTGLIYVPADLVKDSSFPFHDGEVLRIKIEGKTLLIQQEKDYTK